MKKSFKNSPKLVGAAVAALAKKFNTPAPAKLPFQHQHGTVGEKPEPPAKAPKKPIVQTATIGKVRYQSTTTANLGGHDKGALRTRVEVFVEGAWVNRFVWVHDQPVVLVTELRAQFRAYRGE